MDVVRIATIGILKAALRFFVLCRGYGTVSTVASPACARSARSSDDSDNTLRPLLLEEVIAGINI